MCCYTDKYGRPSALCLVPLAFLCMVLGGGLVGTWVGCYYECVRGMEVEYNYYAAVWTGGLAVFSGVFQLFLVCFWNKCLKYFLVIYNVILVLCCLLSTALYAYIAYLESEAVPAGEPSPSLGVILSALQSALAAFVLFFVMMWSCVIGCSSLDDSADAYGDERRATDRPRGRNQRPRDNGGPYQDGFFDREPGIYGAQPSEYRERPQEVSYGHPERAANGAAGYIIPRASVRGAAKDDAHRDRLVSNGGAMVVDGREPRGFYHNSAPSRQSAYASYADDGGAPANGNSLGRARRDAGGRPGELGGRDSYGRGISLMQMHGVAPNARNITDGYY